MLKLTGKYAKFKKKIRTVKKVLKSWIELFKQI